MKIDRSFQQGVSCSSKRKGGQAVLTILKLVNLMIRPQKSLPRTIVKRDNIVSKLDKIPEEVVLFIMFHWTFLLCW